MDGERRRFRARLYFQCSDSCREYFTHTTTRYLLVISSDDNHLFCLRKHLLCCSSQIQAYPGGGVIACQPWFQALAVLSLFLQLDIVRSPAGWWHRHARTHGPNFRGRDTSAAEMRAVAKYGG